jgi:hypothetical protein
MKSNMEPVETGKRKRARLPWREEESIVCVCQLALFKFVFGSVKPVAQSTKGLAVNRQPAHQKSIT